MPDFFEDTLEVVKQFAIPEPHHSIARNIHDGIAIFVLRIVGMPSSVQFYDDAGLMTEEVSDIIIKWSPKPEFGIF